MAARAVGGKSIRRMSSALINDDLLIDFGPDVDSACRDQGLILGDVERVLQTHLHADHLLPIHAVGRAASWGAQNAMPLEWLGTQPSIDAVLNGLGKSAAKMDIVVNDSSTPAKLRLTTIEQWQEVVRGPYRVQTIAANHDPKADPMLFAIESNGRRLLWGADTTELPEDTWPRIAAFGWRFDVVVFDHNDGFTRAKSETHMGSEAVLNEFSTMRKLGIVNDETRLIGTHIAHHSNSTHDVESAKAEVLGYEIAWDGLIVDV